MGIRFLIVVALLTIIGALPGAQSETDAFRRRLERRLAELTSSRKPVHRPAMRALATMGARALPDLALLSRDAAASVRARVATVVSAIDAPAGFPLLVDLARDPAALVREQAILGLGSSGESEAFAPIRAALIDPVPAVRESAALALGLLGDPRALEPLAWWRDAGGELSRLQVAGRRDRPAEIKSIQQAMRASLFSIAARAGNVDDLARALEAVAVPGKLALIEASYQIGDPRLSPALSALLDHRDPQVVADAATALSANGDSRALSALCRVAAGRRAGIEREAAAKTLRRLTGHHAGPGQAWALWWRDHGDRVAELYARDAFIARLHDPSFAATRADLARFPASELMPLVDGFLDQGPPYWPPRALALLRRDDPRRWRAPLLERYDRADADDRERIGLVILLHELRVPDLLAPLRARLTALDAIPAPEAARHPHGSLRAALRQTVTALERAAVSAADGAAEGAGLR